MSDLRLRSLAFNAGPAPGQPPVILEPVAPVVVLVGPNNSGKSTALRELSNWASGEEESRKVLGAPEIQFPDTMHALLRLLLPFEMTDLPAGQLRRADTKYFFYHGSGQPNQPGGQVSFRDVDLQQVLQSGNTQVLRSWVLRPLALLLDGATRFSLIGPMALGDRQAPPQTHLAALFRSDQARETLRALTYKAFHRYLVMEAVGDGQVRLRLSARPPADADEEQSLSARSTAFHAEADLVNDQGDGIKAFVGLLSAAMASPHRLLMVDEPEAFLHPMLSRRLGSDLSGQIAQRDGHLICATHSADFLAGCVDSGAEVDVVRVTNEMGVATARHLPAGQLRGMINDPVIRSARVLNGLFHRAVIVVEGDSDRVFYDEVNRRLSLEGRGIGDALLLTAFDWQTTGKIAQPLRQLGVPAAIIVDFDAIANDHWKHIWAAIGMSERQVSELGQLRKECADVLVATKDAHGKKPWKLAGRQALKRKDKALIDRLLNELARVGIFVVPNGEVESWLASLGVTGKSRWVSRIFEVMVKNGVRPAKGDVWGFLDRVELWVADPTRAGMLFSSPGTGLR